jgi:hypothetical protein
MRFSWKWTAVAAVALGMGAIPGRATVLYVNDFNGTTNGNLVTDATTGQAGFVQTGASTVNPIQVNNGVVTLTTTGQDVSAAFSPVSAGSSVYTEAVVTVTAAATGDYFLHLANTNAGISFQSRLFVKAGVTAGTYLLGAQASSSGVVYGTLELPINVATNVVMRYDIVSGATNDVMTLYVNPTNSDELLNVPYLAATTFTQAENTQTLGAVNFRQGTTGSSPNVTIDNLTVATTFAEVVPEPSALGLLGIAGVFGLRRRRSA